MLRRTIALVLSLIFATMVLAQEATPEVEVTAEAEMTPEATESISLEDQCPILVANAIDFTQRSCSATDTNEACYGYTYIDAAFRSLNVNFIEPGDIEDVIDIQSLRLSPLDVVSGEWGVVVMAIEPNITTTSPDEAPPEDDVQIILYGDTTLSDASQFIEVTALSGVNIRQFPRTSANIIGSLESNEVLIANGRLADNSWFRVRITGNEDASIGWIASDFLEPGFDADTLPEISVEQAEQATNDIATQYGPMQAFIFETGEEDAPCEEAPNSGMLIQTPDGVASVTLWLDEVVIQLDGTGVISAQADGNLTVGIIEGTAEIEANGESSTAVAGQAVDVPLDANLVPSDAPGAPRALDEDEVQALPVDLLNDTVTVPPAGASPIIGTASGNIQWRFNITTQGPYICSDGTEVTFQSAGVGASISAESDAIIISDVRYTEVSTGVYSATYTDSNGNLFQDTIQVISSDRLVGDRIIDFANPICTLTISFSFQLTS